MLKELVRHSKKLFEQEIALPESAVNNPIQIQTP